MKFAQGEMYFTPPPFADVSDPLGASESLEADSSVLESDSPEASISAMSEDGTISTEPVEELVPLTGMFVNTATGNGATVTPPRPKPMPGQKGGQDTVAP